MTAPRPVRVPSRADRARDGIAVGLLVLGVAGYLVAQRGMASLVEHRPYTSLVGPGGGSNLEIWGRYWQLSRASLVVAAIGVAVGIWSFVTHHRTPAAPAAPDGQEDRT